MVEKHIHKYKRIVLSERTGTKVFKCVQCPTFKQRNLIIGEDCICWSCGNTFKLNKANTRCVHPKCNNCRFGREISEVEKVIAEKEEDKLEKFMKSIGL